MIGGTADVLLAGALPGGKAGNPVSSDVMLRALREVANVTLLSHHIAPPQLRESRVNGAKLLRVGVQPIFIHGEGIAAGLIHRKQLRRWPLAWAVNSRYASALHAGSVPYVIWEATTGRDELAVSSLADVRRSARGTGAGFLLHRSLLPLGERLEGRLYRNAAAVFAMSEYTRDRIVALHRLDPSAVGVLAHPPGPALTNVLDQLAKKENSTKDGNRPWRLLFVGRVDDARKNFVLLPRVMRRLSEAGHNAVVTVIGPYSGKWRDRIPLHGAEDRTTFLGPVSLEALASAYLRHDLLLVPSRQEGFGIVVSEAFSAGLPVVATRCGGPEGIIRESGAGVLVEIEAAEMAKAISDLMEDAPRREAMRERALTYARGPLSFGHFAQRVREITLDAIRRAA